MPQEGLLKVDNVTKADYELLKDGSEVTLLYSTVHMSGNPLATSCSFYYANHCYCSRAVLVFAGI